MLDVLVFIGLVNVSFFGLYSLFVLPGLLLAGCVLAAYAYFDLLPSTMWTHGRPSFYDCLQMAIIQDGIQFCLHMLEHRFHFQSHRVHHRHVHPTSLDAFHTGTMDGLIQLSCHYGLRFMSWGLTRHLLPCSGHVMRCGFNGFTQTTLLL